MTHFCSIASRYALPHARVLGEALAEHHPNSRLLVLLLGDLEEALGEAEPFDVIWLSEWARLSGDGNLMSHAWADIATVMRPRLMQLLIERGASAVVYLEADLDVVASLERVVVLARDHGVVLMPRTPEGVPDDGLEPGDLDLLAAGRISPALIAVSAAQPAQHFLRWWSDRLADTAESLEPAEAQATNLVDPSQALSRWLDIAPAVFGSGSTMLEDPGFGLSVWNLHARPLTSVEGQLFAGDSLLRCVHFSGFRADRPYWLSVHGTRARVIDDPLLSELCASYSKRLLRAGWVNPERHAGRLADGTAYDARLRRLHARAVASGEAFGDIFSPAGTERFISWLEAPAERGGDAGVTRYLYDAYLERSDLQEAMPEIDGRDAERLIAWAWEHGRFELGLSPSLLGGSQAATADHQLGVTVVGHLTESFGLGQAARLYVTALRAAEIPVATLAAPVQLPVRRARHRALARYGRQPFAHVELAYDPPFNLLCVNPDALPALLEHHPDMLETARFTIGQWGWETDILPPHWRSMFDRIDELWAYSRYTADMLSRWSPVPVVTIPLPVVVPEQGATESLDFGSDFIFLFTFDFFSTLQRKNPNGLVDAFIRAFAPGEGPRLVLKSINGSFRPEAVDALRWRIGDRRDIELIDRHLAPGSYGAMLARSDCYVSLHRAEGFGLTIAESMALGKPVVATGYSGNLDFMTPANSYLVDYRLTKVGSDAEHYPANGTWAEPNLDHAAELMRHVWEHRDEAIRRGQRAARDVSETLSPEVVGGIARTRLELLAKSLQTTNGPRRASEPARVEFEEIERNLAVDLGRGLDRRRGLARLARRVVLRLMRPFTHHQRKLDQAIVEQLRRLGTRINSEHAHHERDRIRVRSLEARVASVEKIPSNGQELGGEQPCRGRLDSFSAAMRLRRSLPPTDKSRGDQSSPAEAAPEQEAEIQAIRAVLSDPVLGAEVRAFCSPGSRREARDRHAMSVLLAATLPRDAQTIDVGAHSGAVLRELVRIAPEGKHIAYEPIPELAAWLAKEFPSVTVREAALSDHHGTASFVHVDSAPEYSGFKEREYHGVTDVRKHQITVRTERLDDALPDGFEPDLIKVDVEGAELLVLRGAMETLRRFRPRVIFEHGIGASERYATHPNDVHDLLVGELDMRIFDLDGVGPYSRERFEAVFPEPIWNFIAVP